MVNLENLTVKIKNQIIINGISCFLPKGKITCFIGKSGAGKTTLLKSLVNLIPITDGSITIDNIQIKQNELAKNVGFVFQNFNLFPNLTVLQNCMDPMLVQSIEYSSATKIAFNALEDFGIEELANKYPSELSGGQQQRVAIARSLCLNPKILLLDEPSASLDPINIANLITKLKSLTKSNLTIGISSQDMDFVKKIFDQIYYLESGEIIEQCKNIEDIENFPKIKNFLKLKID